MKRPLRPDETRLWARVASTVRPAHGRTAPELAPEPASAEPPAKTPKLAVVAAAPAPKPVRKTPAPPDRIEPNRHRRIARDREPIGERLDLHGYDQDRARAVLHAFLERAQAEGVRAVLIITGKGTRGDGVLRRRVPEWLAEAPSRARVAGVSPAERQHGGEGALYVALKRLVR